MVHGISKEKPKMLKTIAAIVLATAAPALAQSNCAPLDAVNERLMEGYGEQLRTMGLSENGQTVVSQYVNEETGTWTIVVIQPSGIACLVASGQDWTLREAVNMDDPA
jgi:hypothetical protein